MSTELEAEPKTETSQSTFESLESTRSKTLEGITAKPPSPMPIPDGAKVSETAPSSDIPASSPSSSSSEIPVDLEKFKDFMDYKRRKFDPRIHKLKANGEPELTTEGKLKILAPSKQGILQTAKSFFTGNIPLSDHKLSENEENVAKAQGAAAARMEIAEASAKTGSELYFGLGAALLSSGFLENKRKRSPKVNEALLNYERRTGRAISLPPTVELSVILFADAAEQVATVEECGNRFSGIKNLFGRMVFREGMKNSVKESWFGRLFSRKKKKKEPETEPMDENPAEEKPADAATVVDFAEEGSRGE